MTKPWEWEPPPLYSAFVLARILRMMAYLSSDEANLVLERAKIINKLYPRESHVHRLKDPIGTIDPLYAERKTR